MACWLFSNFFQFLIRFLNFDDNRWSFPNNPVNWLFVRAAVKKRATLPNPGYWEYAVWNHNSLTVDCLSKKSQFSWVNKFQVLLYSFIPMFYLICLLNGHWEACGPFFKDWPSTISLIILDKGSNDKDKNIFNKNKQVWQHCRTCGLMDKASDFGSEDCRFESCHVRQHFFYEF